MDDSFARRLCPGILLTALLRVEETRRLLESEDGYNAEALDFVTTAVLKLRPGVPVELAKGDSYLQISDVRTRPGYRVKSVFLEVDRERRQDALQDPDHPGGLILPLPEWSSEGRWVIRLEKEAFSPAS